MGGERIEFVGVQLLSGNPGNAWVNLSQLQLAVLEGLPYRQKLKVPVISCPDAKYPISSPLSSTCKICMK